MMTNKNNQNSSNQPTLHADNVDLVVFQLQCKATNVTYTGTP